MGAPRYEVSRELTFSAAHQIRMHGGKCERLHGHNWRVRIYARAAELNALGMVVDFADIQRIAAEVCGRFDHRNLSEVPPFDETNTTAENLARFIFVEANGKLLQSEGGRVAISRVDVWESPGSLASYWEE